MNCQSNAHTLVHTHTHAYLAYVTLFVATCGTLCVCVVIKNFVLHAPKKYAMQNQNCKLCNRPRLRLCVCVCVSV